MDEDQPKKASPTAGIPKRITDAEWEQWIELFRQHPGEVVKVSGLMGRPRSRGHIAWHHGWPRQGRPPISELLAADAMKARAKRAELESQGVEEPVVEETPTSDLASDSQRQVMQAMVERDKIRRKALEDSARTRAEEGALINVTRRNTMALGALTAQLLRGAQDLAPKLSAALRSETISIKEGMGVMQKMAVIARLGAEAGKMAVQMERLAMGEPIGDEAATAGGKLTPQDAERWMQLAMRTLQRTRERARGGADESQGSDAPESAEAAAPRRRRRTRARGVQVVEDADVVGVDEVSVGSTKLLN